MFSKNMTKHADVPHTNYLFKLFLCVILVISFNKNKTLEYSTRLFAKQYLFTVMLRWAKNTKEEKKEQK